MDEFLARTNGHDQVDRSEKSPPSKRALEPGTDEHPSKKQVVVRDQPAKPTDVGQEREVRSFLTEYCFVNTIQTLAQARPQPTEGEQLDLDLYARMMRSYLYLTDPANNFGPDVVRTFEEESVRRYGLGRKVAN
ncbi:hypothetical protein EV182_000840 [Spiromyces aspiralis]|uniref:Uncharacterized protein n=1 Tax=Spiromyces aspiralis TaxID=68401 RepID=A0ACC1HTY6_9FUNG|nr:hypothetical protein EV182_000840 [Spiromyces aspiralis]